MQLKTSWLTQYYTADSKGQLDLAKKIQPSANYEFDPELSEEDNLRQLAKNTAHGVAAELAVAAYFDRRGNRLTAELANAVVFEKGDLNDHSTCGKPDFYFLDSETNKFIWIEVKFRSNLRNFNTFGEPEIKSELIDYVWKSSTVIKPDYLLVTNGTDLVSYNYHTRTQTKLDNFRESYALIISTALSRKVNQKKFNTYPEFD